MARAPFGHVSRHCIRCGKVGPRTMVDGDWAHSRCLTPSERRDAHRRTMEARAPRPDGKTPAGSFMRLAHEAMPDGVGTALGFRGDAKVRLDSLNVEAASRRRGHAGQALTRLARIADETGTTLTAEVWTREQGPGAIPQETLATLFERHGFVATGIGHTMRREPAATSIND